jgi:hypothetical protein
MDRSGLLVMRKGRRIARTDCRSGGDLTEHAIFDGLPQDEEDPVPRYQGLDARLNLPELRPAAEPDSTKFSRSCLSNRLMFRGITVAR